MKNTRKDPITYSWVNSLDFREKRFFSFKYYDRHLRIVIAKMQDMDFEGESYFFKKNPEKLYYLQINADLFHGNKVLGHFEKKKVRNRMFFDTQEQWTEYISNIIQLEMSRLRNKTLQTCDRQSVLHVNILLTDNPWRPAEEIVTFTKKEN